MAYEHILLSWRRLQWVKHVCKVLLYSYGLERLIIVCGHLNNSPFFVVYGRDPLLPNGSLLDKSPATYLLDVCEYRTELLLTPKKTHALALESIRNAQEKQRKFYDQ